MKRLASLLLTLSLLFLILYFVPFKELKSAILGVEPLNLFTAFLFYSLSQMLRSIRWKMLLRSFNLYQALLINSANIMFNNLLPARTGELSWFYYAKKLGISFNHSLWSFFVGRLYDFYALFLLLFVSLSIAHRSFMIPALLVFSLGFLFHKLYHLLPTSGRLGSLREFIKKEMSLKLCLNLFLLSSASSILKFGSLLALFELWNPDTYKVFVAFLGGELSSVLPIHNLMGIGTYEFAFSLPLKLLGEGLQEWLKLGFIFHGFLLLSSLLWGIPSAFLLSRRKL
ncbi:MAG: flippase-like domain-containing protein [Aquificaceae bacterium]|nr:flippase-like domain-containing protein [Aquificaceae bacterium]